MKNDPQDLTLSEVQNLPALSEVERSVALHEFGARVAAGSNDENVLPVMVQFATAEVSPSARQAWLAYIGASRSSLFVSLLESWMRDSEEEVRKSILGVLLANRSPRANDLLLHAIQNDPSRGVRRLAVRALVRRGILGEWRPFDLFPIVKEEDWIPITKQEFRRLMERGI